MPAKRKTKTVANMRFILDGDALKYVDAESRKYNERDQPLSRPRIIKKALAGLWKQQQTKRDE